MNETHIPTLYLCATPIGNLEDMTYRAVRVLGDVELIAAEDTRHTRQLLTHFDIHTRLTSYHEHNKFEKGPELIAWMQEGHDLACVSDAGTPAISDPGEVLAARCIEEGIRVTSIPGACALITALTMSGMAARRFCFEGFLPSDKKEHKRILSQLVREERTIILYEAPHRLKTTLEELRDTLGGSRRITLCRELTKRYEEAIPLTLDSALSYYEENEPRGEYVLILAGADPAALAEQDHRSWDTVPLEEHMEIYLSKGMTRKEAMKKVAADRGLSRRDIYRALLQEENG